MRLRVDAENDALYLRLNDTPVVESEEVESGIILDFDEAGRVVGIEILGVNTNWATGNLPSVVSMPNSCPGMTRSQT